MNVLDTAKVAATGVRNGHLRNEDGLLSRCENSRREIDS
jgi:hypothetical protein